MVCLAVTAECFATEFICKPPHKISLIFPCQLDRFQNSVMKNHTAITTFILLALTDDPQLQILLFIFVFLIYLLSVTGNLMIMTLTLVDSHLKTCMYFFLRNFSFLEVSFTTVCIPRFLYSISTGNNSITYNVCTSQIFFVILFGATEFFLLVAVYYDHYVAICKSLHLNYMTIMNNRVSTFLVLSCWVSGLMIIILLRLQLESCVFNVNDHFCCDAGPLLKNLCSDTWVIEQMVILVAVFALIIILVCIFLSYTYITRTILRFPSVQQRKKPLSTCSSHMTVVSTTCGSFFICVRPRQRERWPSAYHSAPFVEPLHLHPEE